MYHFISRISKILRKQISNYHYHQFQKHQANDILKNIESVKGKTEPKLIKLSNEYANDILGWRGYAPWLYVYSAMAEDFKEGWIPDNYYGQVVVPSLQGEYGKVSHLKPLTKMVFKNKAFPDIAYFVNRLFYSKNYDVLREEEIKDYLFKYSNVVVFKSDNSLQGKGVFLLEKDTFNIKRLQLLGNGVFQYFIEQHQFFNELMPNSVANIRMTTILDDFGNASVRACFLRIARGEDSHVKSASQIKVPIDIKSGELDAQGYLTSWLPIDRHPDTNAIFAKQKIPGYNNCVSVALDLHKLMPYVRSIGWDMIVDKNNEIKVMEWNGWHNGIKFSEATQGPCFSDLGWEKLNAN